MNAVSLSILLLFTLGRQSLAQLATTITKDGNGKSIYIPQVGSTSSVAAPAATPTLIYNCFTMPLICENVAAWAKQVFPAGNGDLNGNQLFYFDPEPSSKDTRRQKACGCFSHDDCVGSGVSKGKRAGDKVTDIAAAAGPFATISASDEQIIKAGSNPNPNGQRTPLSSIPGRFFADGVGLTCDEFPAATFIQGGDGAQAICALQSWQVYLGSAASGKNVGKWPLPPRSGNRQEQDWQASSHAALRKILGIGSTKKRTGYDTVYPFSFSTTTLATSSSKAWVIANPQSSVVVSKRGLPPQTITQEAGPQITINVSGDDDIDEANPYLGSNHHARRHATGRSFQSVEALPTATPSPTLPDGISSLPPRAVRKALLPRASDCANEFDTQGLEDTEVGDPAFDDDLPDEVSSPQCNANDIPASDAQAVNDQLDEQGDDGYSFNNCCGGGGTCAIVGISGFAAVNICGDAPQQCIGCARVANYVQGLIDTCKNEEGNVGGKQDINEAPGLTVELNFNTHH